MELISWDVKANRPKGRGAKLQGLNASVAREAGEHGSQPSSRRCSWQSMRKHVTQSYRALAFRGNEWRSAGQPAAILRAALLWWPAA